ncbi:MAG: insulinase family protein [Bacteroidales bacterium]|nr:insulinase family protein [Candidatus Latescibacterota bacterium]
MLKLPRPKKVILDCGATLLYQRNPVSPTVAFGVWVSRGSRDETESERGYSHLLEHMVFRGTKSRSALKIAFDLESIGGQWDAFTSKESTCYHGKVLEEHFGDFAEILSDIVLSPSIPTDALVLEKKVVQEEIRSVNDSPEESTYELFFKSLFGDDQLGYPVAGRLKDIPSCDRRRLLAFHRKTYIPSNTIFAFIGNIPFGKVISTIEENFVFQGNRSAGRARKTSKFSSKRIVSGRRPDWGQSHVCIGTRTISASDPDRYPLLVLSNILGGGVSSRLFQNLREKNGLAYAVFSHANFWSDTGAFASYFSVDPRNLGKAMDIFMRCMEDLRTGGALEEEMASAKSQLKASVVFGVESVDSRLFRLIHSECYHKRHRTLDSVIKNIERVRPEDVARVMEIFLPEKRHTYVTCGKRRLRGFIRRGSR